jgi:hypothetical protein
MLLRPTQLDFADSYVWQECRGSCATAAELIAKRTHVQLVQVEPLSSRSTCNVLPGCVTSICVP